MKEFDEDEIYHEMYVHLLWSTAKQQPSIPSSLFPSLYSYMCDSALTHECYVIAGQVFTDHIQLIVKFSPHTPLTDLIKTLKLSSLLWLRTNFPTMKNFEWQGSDFAFSVSSEEVGSLIEKIQNAKAFSEEVLLLLDQNEMQHDLLEVLE